MRPASAPFTVRKDVPVPEPKRWGDWFVAADNLQVGDCLEFRLEGRKSQNYTSRASYATTKLRPKRFVARYIPAEGVVRLWRVEDAARRTGPRLAHATANALESLRTDKCPECGKVSLVAEWIGGRCLDCAPLGERKAAS